MNKNIKPMVFDLVELENKARDSSGLACYILGRSFDSQENGAEQNYEKAMYWYKRGADLNDPRAIYGVAACYHFGDGIAQDVDKAKELFIQAYEPLLELIKKEEGNPQKQAFSKFVLGAYYYFGFGNVQADKEKAFELIYASAMQGHIAGIYDLGANFYFNGVGTKKDLDLAKYYLELAAKHGLPRAKAKLEEYSKVFNEVSR